MVNERLMPKCRHSLQNTPVCISKILKWWITCRWHDACCWLVEVGFLLVPNQPVNWRSEKGFPVVLAVSRFFLLVSALALTIVVPAPAAPVTVDFTAVIGTGNSVDTDNVFGEGFGTNLAHQVIVGSAMIDPTALVEVCRRGRACYSDFGAGAISISFTLNGITSTVVSGHRPGSFIDHAVGSVSISDPSHGGYTYLAVAATDPDGMVQQSIGVLFNNRTLFSAYGNGVPSAAIASLAHIGAGSGLVGGGITFLSPVEHLDATILTIAVQQPAGLAQSGDASNRGIDVSEPSDLALFCAAMSGLGMVRRKRAG